MRRWEEYFHSPYSAARPFLFSRVFLLVLAMDIWFLMIGHAGRYSVLGFNVAQFRWLDFIQPIPTPGLYIGVLIVTGVLAIVVALTGPQRLLLLILFLLYTFSWSMSMLDSYQHHYFLSLVLLCLIFFPQIDSAETSRSVSGFGFPLLGVTTAIVYTYTAIAKMDAAWVGGQTLRQMSSAQKNVAPVIDLASRLGIAPERFWSLLATAVIPMELFIAVGYLVAVSQDRNAAAVVRIICRVAFVLSLILHLSADAMGLRIGWFSDYMLLLAVCFLLPRQLLERAAILIVTPFRRLSQEWMLWRSETQTSLPLILIAGSLSIATVLLVGYSLDLPGAVTAAMIVAGILLIQTLAAILPARPSFKAASYSMATAFAAVLLWVLAATTSIRWNYYQYLAADLAYRGEYESALATYDHGERYAPDHVALESERDRIRRRMEQRAGDQFP